MRDDAGPAADQPSRLRTPPGVGPRCRRLGAQVSVTRLNSPPSLHDLFAREVPRRLDVDDGTRFAVGTLARTLLMLKLITLAACVIGFFVLGPKALAEFRQARSRTRTRLSDNAKNKDTPDKPSSSAAA